MKNIISMPKFGYLTVGKDKTKVHLYYLKFLNTLFVSFLGGRPHVGAVTAVIKPNSKRYIKTLRMPGHRDDVVTKKAGAFLSTRVKGPVIAMAGIHYNQVTRPQINTIVKNSSLLCRKLMTQLTQKDLSQRDLL